jgi:hypothetical protein
MPHNFGQDEMGVAKLGIQPSERPVVASWK